MKSRLFMAGFACYSVAVLILADAALSDEKPPQTSPAIVTEPPPPTVVTIPIATSSSTSTSVAANSTESAHEALQADITAADVIAALDPALPCLEWVPLALEVGWPAEELPTLLPILWRESRCQPWADSGPDHGLAQVNQIHSDYLAQLGMTFEDMKDPRANLAFAFRLWSEREAAGKCGWTPWSVTCD